MNIININKYTEFSHILNGCRTILDAVYFANIYSLRNPEMYNIIYSMVYGKRYEKVLDFKTMIIIIETIKNSDNKDSIDNLIYDLIYSDAKKTTDPAQIKTIMRLRSSKIFIQNDIIVQNHNKNIKLISKKCPHCNNSCLLNENHKYVICGYTDTHTGYDWNGCGKDWCFKCGKKLCKSWIENNLHVEINRTHNKECCHTHSKIHGFNYPDDYCICTY